MIVDLTVDDPARVGGKGAGLARLARLELPVPPTVVVPVEAAGVLSDPTPVLDRLGTGPFAVRSSGVGEDGADRSAAGQYESLMGVRASGLVDAVAHVHASAMSDRVRAYRGGVSAPMAVVIQRELRADKAGVAFSHDPVTGRPELQVECVFGHGEQLVSGAANPDRYSLQGDGSVRTRVAVRAGPNRTMRTLRDDEVLAVEQLVGRASAGFEAPVDVEFCFEGGALWLLQCRAITTL